MTNEDRALQRCRIYPLQPAAPSRLESLMVKWRWARIARCSVCGRIRRFAIEHDNLRETVRCSGCGAISRQRQLAYVICARLSEVLGRRVTSLRQLAARDGDALAIYNTETAGPVHAALSTLRHYLCSEYVGPEFPSGAVVNGVPHQDLMRLSYPDDSIDLVLSSDVFEHIPQPYTAHQEVHRVLRPGGRHIFTVPFYQTEFADETRAVLGEDGTPRVIRTPLYHDDPIRPNRGILVYTIFALEMLLKLDRIGFTTHLYRLRHPFLGLLGPNALVFEAVKRTAGEAGLRVP